MVYPASSKSNSSKIKEIDQKFKVLFELIRNFKIKYTKQANKNYELKTAVIKKLVNHVMLKKVSWEARAKNEPK